MLVNHFLLFDELHLKILEAEASSRCPRWVSAAAALPALCLDNRKCKICVQPRVAESHWWFQSAAASEDGSELERLRRAGRIRPRVFLQAAAATRPRLGCKTVVKQTGLFLFYCLHGMTFVLWLPLPHLFPSPLCEGTVWCPMLPFWGSVQCVEAAWEGHEAGRGRKEWESLSVCHRASAVSWCMPGPRAAGPDIIQTRPWWRILSAVRQSVCPFIDYPSARGHKWPVIIWLRNIFPTSDLSLEVNQINPAGSAEHDFAITHDLLVMFCLLLHHWYVGSRGDKWVRWSFKPRCSSCLLPLPYRRNMRGRHNIFYGVQTSPHHLLGLTGWIWYYQREEDERMEGSCHHVSVCRLQCHLLDLSGEDANNLRRTWLYETRPSVWVFRAAWET